MKVQDLEIEDIIKKKLQTDGIEKLFPPQTEAIQKGILAGKNVVVAIPTASGKTLLAILAIFEKLRKFPKTKAIYLAPLKALASEKYEEIQEFATLLGYKVGLSTSDFDSNVNWFWKKQIIVATNEKFDSTLRYNPDWLERISIVISDEIHLIENPDRGPVLEVVLARLLNSVPDCQIIALSATIKNAQELAEWLKAELVISEWRPVKLKEGVWANGRIHYPDNSYVTMENVSKIGYIDLAIDCVKQGGQSLVFCNTRKSVISSATQIGYTYNKILTSQDRTQLIEVVNKLKRSGEKTKLLEDLISVVNYGVGFHHAGLNNMQRKIVEEAYKKQILKIITASPTLCLASKTKIWSSHYSVQVKDFDGKEKLWTKKDNSLFLAHACGVIKNPPPLKLLELSSNLGYKIQVTYNHKVLVKRENMQKIIPAFEVRKFDLIATAGRLSPSKFERKKLDSNLLAIKNNVLYLLGVAFSKSQFSSSAILKFSSKNVYLKIAKEILNSFDVPYIFQDANNKVHLVVSTDKLGNLLELEKNDKKFVGFCYFQPLFLAKPFLRGIFEHNTELNSKKGILLTCTSKRKAKAIQKLLLYFGIVGKILVNSITDTAIKPKKIEIRTKHLSTTNFLAAEKLTLARFQLLIEDNRSIITFFSTIGLSINHQCDILQFLINKFGKQAFSFGCKVCSSLSNSEKFKNLRSSWQCWIARKKYFSPEENDSKYHLDKEQNDTYSKNFHSNLMEIVVGTNITLQLNSTKVKAEHNLQYTYSKKVKLQDIFRIKCMNCKNQASLLLDESKLIHKFENDIFWDTVNEIKAVNNTDNVFDIVLKSNPKNDHMFIAEGFIVHNSSGVNLPGRRVIIRSLTRYNQIKGNHFIPVLEYKQMAGRAGRPKYDKYGEAIIIANKNGPNEMLKRYVTADIETIYSKFGSEVSLRSHLLGFITSNNVTDFESAMEIVSTTFYGHQNSDQLFFIEDTILHVLDQLVAGKLISKKEPYFVTKFGELVAKLYLDPLSATIIRDGLLESKDRIDLKAIAYFWLLVRTPDSFTFFYRESEIDFLLDKLEENSNQNMINEEQESEIQFNLRLREMKTITILDMWIEETSEQQIEAKTNITSGDIHSIIGTISWLFVATEKIAKLFRLDNHEVYLNELKLRIQYGIKAELLELIKLHGIGRKRARKLYNQGFRSIKDISPKRLRNLEQILGKKVAQTILKNLREGVKENVPLGEVFLENEEEEVLEQNQQSLDAFF